MSHIRVFKWFALTLILAAFLCQSGIAQSDSGLAADADTVLSESSAEMTETSSMTDTVSSAGYEYPISAERKAKLISYSRFVNIWRFVGFFVTLGVMALILFTGLSAKLRDWAGVAKKKFLIVWLFVIMFVIVDYLLNFPFHFYRSFVVENQYGFLNQSFGEWLGEDLLGLLVTMVAIVIPVWFLYWLINKARLWWLWMTVIMIPIMVFFIVIAPVLIDPLFNKYEPLQDKQLEAEILQLASAAGIEGSDVFQVNASKQSAKVNAYVTGLFGTKRIVLYDTMIDNFETDEMKFVMGHEMGHYVMHHIWKGLGLAVLFIAFALWLTGRTINPIIIRFKSRFKFDRLGDIASLPLVLIFLTVLGFLFNPVSNGYSRHMERQSDKYGMDISKVSGESAAIAFDKLSVINLSDPDPHPLIEFWFYTHPALSKRINFVLTYKPEGS
ncbi:MAG: M48 family metallopeptidase [Candidatus Zixiibacteriota bacterium]|nr:MAG: M48 family metallopeptidase [candidate division Zixibacteria bacterium]